MIIYGGRDQLSCRNVRLVLLYLFCNMIRRGFIPDFFLEFCSSLITLPAIILSGTFMALSDTQCVCHVQLLWGANQTSSIRFSTYSATSSAAARCSSGQSSPTTSMISRWRRMPPSSAWNPTLGVTGTPLLKPLFVSPRLALSAPRREPKPPS